MSRAAPLLLLAGCCLGAPVIETMNGPLAFAAQGGTATALDGGLEVLLWADATLAGNSNLCGAPAAQIAGLQNTLSLQFAFAGQEQTGSFAVVAPGPDAGDGVAVVWGRRQPDGTFVHEVAASGSVSLTDLSPLAGQFDVQLVPFEGDAGFSGLSGHFTATLCP